MILLNNIKYIILSIKDPIVYIPSIYPSEEPSRFGLLKKVTKEYFIVSSKKEEFKYLRNETPVYLLTYDDYDFYNQSVKLEELFKNQISLDVLNREENISIFNVRDFFIEEAYNVPLYTENYIKYSDRMRIFYEHSEFIYNVHRNYLKYMNYKNTNTFLNIKGMIYLSIQNHIHNMQNTCYSEK